MFLELFDSEDFWECEYFKIILYWVYGKFLGFWVYICKQCNYIFFWFIYEFEYFNGVVELLEILGSIINGFVLFLKMEYKQFLVCVLIFLYFVKLLFVFYVQLVYCVVQFLEKDVILMEYVIWGLFKYWLKICIQKEVMFLGEMEEIFDVIEFFQFVKIQEFFFKQVVCCVFSFYFQVVEWVLYFWNNEYILSFIEDNCYIVLFVVFGIFY